MLKVLHILIWAGLFNGFSTMENENNTVVPMELDSPTIVTDLDIGYQDRSFMPSEHQTIEELKNRYEYIILNNTHFFLNSNTNNILMACPEEYFIRSIDLLFTKIKQLDPSQEETIIRLINGFVNNQWHNIFQIIDGSPNPNKLFIKNLTLQKKLTTTSNKSKTIKKTDQSKKNPVKNKDSNHFFTNKTMDKYLINKHLEKQKQAMTNELKIVCHILFHINENLKENSMENIIEAIYHNPSRVFTSDVLNNLNDPKFLQLILSYQDRSLVFTNDGGTNMSQMGPQLLASINAEISSGPQQTILNPMIIPESINGNPLENPIEIGLMEPADDQATQEIKKNMNLWLRKQPKEF